MISAFLSLVLAVNAASFRLPLRSRVEAFQGSGAWEEVRLSRDLAPRETAIVICDMWDHHWCSGAEKRVGILAPKMVKVIESARAAGIVIIHAPSDTMDFYKEYPQRRRMLEIPRVQPPANLDLPDPPLPIDDKAGGCDTGETAARPYPWTREHSAIPVAAEDCVSDKGVEIYSLLRQRSIRNLLVMGVHTNMCILNRTFAIKQMTRWGIRAILVRDLTDAMYDPKQRPFVSHEEGTELVIQHIEKYWCPTALSGDLVTALGRH